MKKFIIKQAYISGSVVGLISFIIYFSVIMKGLMLLFFGNLKGAEICGMGGLFVMVILLFSFGVSLIISILSGVYMSKYLHSKVEYQLK